MIGFFFLVLSCCLITGGISAVNYHFLIVRPRKRRALTPAQLEARQVMDIKQTQYQIKDLDEKLDEMTGETWRCIEQWHWPPTEPKPPKAKPKPKPRQSREEFEHEVMRSILDRAQQEAITTALTPQHMMGQPPPQIPLGYQLAWLGQNGEELLIPTHMIGEDELAFVIRSMRFMATHHFDLPDMESYDR